MIALRTNDNPLQSAKVDAWLRENATARSPAYVDHIVLCELALYETGPADFSGYLLAERARAAGFAPVLTLDKKAAKAATHQLLR